MSLSLKEALERDVPPTDGEITPELERAAELWGRMAINVGLIPRHRLWVQQALEIAERTGRLGVHQARAMLELARSANGMVRGTPVPDGTYTVVLEENLRRTLRFRTQKRNVQFYPGRQIASFLAGPENTKDYVSFAFVERDGSLRVWRRFAERADLVECARVILGDPLAAAKAYALESGRCALCGRVLTVPESIERGIGPECARRI
jgi:hypothetical protein